MLFVVCFMFPWFAVVCLVCSFCCLCSSFLLSCVVSVRLFVCYVGCVLFCIVFFVSVFVVCFLLMCVVLVCVVSLFVALFRFCFVGFSLGGGPFVLVSVVRLSCLLFAVVRFHSFVVELFFLLSC